MIKVQCPSDIVHVVCGDVVMLDIAEHVVLDTPLHGDWLPVFVLDSRGAAVASVFLHFQQELGVELGLCLHLVLLLGLDGGLLQDEW